MNDQRRQSASLLGAIELRMSRHGRLVKVSIETAPSSEAAE